MTSLDTQRQLFDILARLERLEKLEFLNFQPFASYVPTYTGSATAGTTTYTLQVGSYVLLDFIAIVRGTVVWTAATGTGDARISLPIAANSSSNNFYSGSLRLTGVTFANGTPQMMINPGTAYFTMDSPLTNAAPTTVAIEAAGNVVFTVVYFTD